MRSFFKDKKEKDKERKAAISLLCPSLVQKIKAEYVRGSLFFPVFHSVQTNIEFQWNDVVNELKAHTDSIADIASWTDEKSTATLLHIAAERGALPVLEFLTSVPGVNLNVTDKGGRNAELFCLSVDR